ncbi:hypothetical protein LINPERHAP1_LOCUS38242 [Linum perenne]
MMGHSFPLSANKPKLLCFPSYPETDQATAEQRMTPITVTL